MEEKIGVIDLGSNSVRLMLMRIYPNGSFKLIDEIKEGVRLSQGMEQDGCLQLSAMQRTIDTIRLFTKLCRSNGIERVIAVATAAVRAAANQAEFLAQLYQQTGIQFRVLSGEEEAYYVYQGVVNSLETKSGIIVDIGGGSTEIIKIKERQLIHSTSLPFGAVNMTEKFLSKDKNSPGQLEKMESFLRETFNKIPWLREEKNVGIMGIGGTIRNLAKIDRRRKNYPLEITHNYRLAAQDLHGIYEDTKTMNLEQRKKVPGLSKDRADIIIAGFAIINGISQFIKAKELIVSGNGLREGIFYNYLLGKRDMVMVENVLAHSIENFMRFYDIREHHANHVCKLVLNMFDQLQDLHDLGEEERKLLWVSSLIHDCGIAINYYNHSRHTFYLLTNSRINGLSHRELVMCAFICVLHSQEDIKKKYLTQYRDLLAEDDYEKIYKLGVLLRICTGLDRSTTGIVEDLCCYLGNDYVEVKTVASSNADLEICQANRSADLFKKIYSRNLIIS